MRVWKDEGLNFKYVWQSGVTVGMLKQMIQDEGMHGWHTWDMDLMNAETGVFYNDNDAVHPRTISVMKRKRITDAEVAI